MADKNRPESLVHAVKDLERNVLTKERREQRKQGKVARRARWSWYIGASAFFIRLTALVWLVAVTLVAFLFIQDAINKWGEGNIDVNAALTGGGVVIAAGAIGLFLWWTVWNLFQLERWAALVMLVVGLGSLLGWYAMDQAQKAWPAPPDVLNPYLTPWLFDWGVPAIAGATVVILLLGQKALSE